VQHKEIYEALFSTGVAFSLSLHSSNYLTQDRKQHSWLVTLLSRKY